MNQKKKSIWLRCTVFLLLLTLFVQLPVNALAADANSDTEAPAILNVNPSNQAIVYTSMPMITAVLKDADSGIDSATISVKVNTIKVPHIYDPGSKIVAAATANLPNGTYSLTIDANDQAGNKALQWSSTFSVSVDQTNGKIYYLALGDSLAAGLAPDTSIGIGYTDMLAQYLRSSGFLGEFNKNHTSPGYTTQNILDNIKNNVPTPDRVTIKQAIAKSNVITIDAGANDFIQKLDSQFNMDPVLAKSLLEQVGANMAAILTEIRQLNPKASIYIMGYYDAFHNFALPPLQKLLLTSVLDELNAVIAAVSQKAGAVFVPTKEAIAIDYTKNLPVPTNIHPSQQGYKAIADAIWNVMQTPYAWSPSSTLTAKDIASSSLTLNWTPANGAISEYKVFAGAKEIGTVSGSVYNYNVTSLSPDTSYAFKVESKLSNGLWSINGPELTQKTATAPPTSGSGGAPSSTVNQLTAAQLNDLIKSSGTASNVAIELTKDSYTLLPNNAGELLQSSKKGLEIKSNGQSVVIPSAVLTALAKKLTAGALKDAQIKVSFKAIEAASVSSSVYAANAASGAVIKQYGSLYEFDLAIESKDGKSTRLDHFIETVTLNFKLASSTANPELLGIYYLNESSKKWEYVGGKRSKDNGAIEAALTHNSKYAVLEYTKTYKDVPSTHWAFTTIQALSAKQVIEGVSEEEFAPSKTTTRAQFVTMLVRSLGIQAAGTPSAFADVAQGAWYSEAVSTAVQAGIVKGIDDSHFAPNASITREQMAVLLVRAYEYKSGISLQASDKLSLYADANKVSSWAIADLNKAIAAGLMTGRDEDSFAPEAVTVRAETAKAIYNLLTK
ncbi:S-layer homology domain-containing protein [Paenibacillus sp. MCAF9]|uniref:S-layer homology domain-containing protein n=1 Tax=Paenibacillus sp. MCAF9 TaxID=3233046 RepID=UPI003F9E9467